MATQTDAALVAALDADMVAYIEQADVDEREDAIFEELALRAFEHQFGSCTPYRRYCESLGTVPPTVRRWHDIPPIPAVAYKESTIATCAPQDAVHVYRSSGTSGRPSVMHRDEAAEAVCRVAQLRAHKEYMLPDRDRIRFMLLAPSPELMPHAGFAHCMDLLMRTHGTADSERHFGPTGVDFEPLLESLRQAEREGEPVGLYGAAFTFVHFFDWCRHRGAAVRLPTGSRINHGSGYKGRSRELTREEFVAAGEVVLGIPPSHNVDVLGMTELGSQFYDRVLRDAVHGAERPRAKAELPWTRTRVLDPVSLEPVPVGTAGVLAHYDLSLRGNVLAVLTEDVGVAVDDGGFEILGRIEGAEARGCNLTIEEFMSAQQVA